MFGIFFSNFEFLFLSVRLSRRNHETNPRYPPIYNSNHVTRARTRDFLPSISFPNIIHNSVCSFRPTPTRRIPNILTGVSSARIRNETKRVRAQELRGTEHERFYGTRTKTARTDLTMDRTAGVLLAAGSTDRARLVVITPVRESFFCLFLYSVP